MPAPFKLGQTARQIVQPIQGEVVQVVYDDKTDKFRALVRSPDASERWFWQDEIEDVPAAPQEA